METIISNRVHSTAVASPLGVLDLRRSSAAAPPAFAPTPCVLAHALAPHVLDAVAFSAMPTQPVMGQVGTCRVGAPIAGWPMTNPMTTGAHGNQGATSTTFCNRSGPPSGSPPV